MIKNKKQMFIVIGAFVLVMLLGTVTYAFFNYTRTGTANRISVGRIAFVTRQTDTINLTNLFPIDPTDSTAMNDDTKVGTIVIEIEGDTDYSEGVEYLVSVVDSSITTNGKTLPISLDITVTTLGAESSSYWTARESKNATIYKKLVGATLEGNKPILVGYIKPNTTSGIAEGVDGSITIKAYLDENKVLISDTYNNGNTPTDNLGTPANLGEGKTVFTTQEWNSLQSNGASFKVKVESNEGIWVEEPEPPIEAGVYYWTDETDEAQNEFSSATFYTVNLKYTEEEINQIPKNYFVKTIVTPTVAPNNLYDIRYVYNSNIYYESEVEGLLFNSLEECNNVATNNYSDAASSTCFIKYQTGETYAKLDYEACMKANNSYFCIPYANDNWNNIESYKTLIENNGFICGYSTTGSSLFYKNFTNDVSSAEGLFCSSNQNACFSGRGDCADSWVEKTHYQIFIFSSNPSVHMLKGRYNSAKQCLVYNHSAECQNGNDG